MGVYIFSSLGISLNSTYPEHLKHVSSVYSYIWGPAHGTVHYEEGLSYS